MTVNTLSLDIKNFLKAYYTENMPYMNVGSKPRRKRELRDINEIPEYEKLYEPQSSGLSFESAAMIEELSWETTERLVEAFSEEIDPIAPEVDNSKQPEPVSETADGDFIQSLSPEDKKFLAAAHDADGALQSAIAAEAGSLPDIIADRINTLAADVFGDIVLEESDGIYIVIEDYEEEIGGALNDGK
jgi:hypothetical protein